MRMHSARCKLPEPSVPYSGSEHLWLQASASGLLWPLRHGRGTAEYRHRTRQALRMWRSARSHDPKKQPATAQWRSISMIVFSSLCSRFERSVVGKAVHQIGFTREGRRDDSEIWPGRKRDRMSRRRRLASPLLGRLCVVLAAVVFPVYAFSNPLTEAPARVASNEVSIAQVPQGMRLRFTRRRTVITSTHPHTETVTPLRKMAEAAATAHTLPVNYFLRLIRQESGFDPNSVSPAGAQGIAQFMPATASARGLKDPFDPAEALPKSAELLNELKDHFGNLGLAAAAYNAGPDRIRRWLAGETQLPQETINYVRVITGHDAADWAKSNDLAINLSADAFEPSSRLHLNRLSWEAQLLATLRATSADGSATSVSTASTGRMGEASLCSHCILQTAY